MLKLPLSGKEVLKEGVQPGVGGWELGGAIDEGEGESLVRLDQDGGGGAVGPLVSRDRLWGGWWEDGDLEAQGRGVL